MLFLILLLLSIPVWWYLIYQKFESDIFAPQIENLARQEKALLKQWELFKEYSLKTDERHNQELLKYWIDWESCRIDWKINIDLAMEQYKKHRMQQSIVQCPSLWAYTPPPLVLQSQFHTDKP